MHGRTHLLWLTLILLPALAARAHGDDLERAHAHHEGHTRGVFCRRCGTKVSTTAHSTHVPSSSADMVQALPAVAPGATLSRHRSSPASMWYDVATFQRATNLVTQGKPQSAQSFFPPYRWEPIFCKTCGAHLGWRFVAKRRQDKDMTCPLDLDLPPMRPPDLSGSAQSDFADANVLPSESFAGDRVVGGADATDDTAASLSTARTDIPTTTGKQKRLKASSLLAALKGYCATKQTGYWIYEWCYQKHVRQFHLEAYKDGLKVPVGAKIVTVSGTKYLKNPDWSLGQWEPKAHASKAGRKPFLWPDTRQKGKTREPKFVSHLHVGGQRCDETGDGRRTEVRLLCCSKEDAKKKKEVKSGNKGDKSAAGISGISAGSVEHNQLKDVSIRSLEETSTCRYRIEVCVPSLCKRDDFRPPSIPKPQPTPTEKIQEKMHDFQESRKKCSFFGLIWDRLLLQDSPSYKWISSVSATTGIRQER